MNTMSRILTKTNIRNKRMCMPESFYNNIF